MPRYVRNRQAVEEKSEQLNDFLTRKKNLDKPVSEFFGCLGGADATPHARFLSLTIGQNFFLAFLFLLIRSSWIDSSRPVEQIKSL